MGNKLKTYDETSASALRGLAGDPLNGGWTLAVQDLAAADSGSLAKWELELGFTTSDVIEVSEAPGLLIPDNVAAGIERTLAVTGVGRVGELKVSVDITHTFIGDLVVTLISPSGRVATLHARAGGDADNLIATYASANVAALQAMIGESLAGAWRLRVADLDKVDTGKPFYVPVSHPYYHRRSHLCRADPRRWVKAILCRNRRRGGPTRVRTWDQGIMSPLL